ncbi:MAG TPA: DUF1566 domain-containing protein [Anaeromyxobacteraceae bacterium]|nr:DUF1566 domain-containing protein [Anaeromyxobacteraceae bacterium]
MKRSASLAVVAFASVAVACGSDSEKQDGRVQPPDDGPSDALAECTGLAPANASPCPGAQTGLTVDTPRFVGGAAGSCTEAKCGYACLAGMEFVSGACVVPPRPNGSFADNGDGTVTDELTGLVWLRSPNCTEPLGGVAPQNATLRWPDAITWLANLRDGSCGLSDGSAPGDWRVPSHAELADFARSIGSAPTVPFTFRPTSYWTGDQPCAGQSEAVLVPDGSAEFILERELRAYWAVRAAVEIP